MGAAEDERVHLGPTKGVEVAVGDVEHFRPGRRAGLDELDEARAGLGEDLRVRRGGEGVEVGARAVGALGRDDPDAVVAGGQDRAPHGRADDLGDGHVVALARVVQDGCARGVARDDEQLDPVVDESVEALEGELAGLRDRPGAVGRSRRVTEVGDRLVRQLVDDGAGDGQPPEAGVEDADRLGSGRRVAHSPSSSASSSSSGSRRSASSPVSARVSDSCSQVRKS